MFLNKIKKKSSEDNGNAIAVLGLILVLATLLIGGLLLDITKAFEMKASYNDVAQKAAQASIRYQNAEGYLTADAIGEAVRVYEWIARPAVINGGYMDGCGPIIDFNTMDRKRDIDITVTLFKTENFAEDLANGRYYRTTFNPALYPFLNSYSTAQEVANSMGLNNNNITAGKYIGLEIETIEETPNVVLPNVSFSLGVGEGSPLKCQKLGVRAGASVYLGTEGVHG